MNVPRLAQPSITLAARQPAMQFSVDCIQWLLQALVTAAQYAHC